MTQMSPTAMPGRPAPAARSNIYTVLIVLAALALAIGVGFLAMKNMELTNEGNPFFVINKS